MDAVSRNLSGRKGAHFIYATGSIEQLTSHTFDLPVHLQRLRAGYLWVANQGVDAIFDRSWTQMKREILGKYLGVN